MKLLKDQAAQGGHGGEEALIRHMDLNQGQEVLTAR